MKLPYLNSTPDVPKAIWAWAKRLIDDLNRGDTLNQYTDDAAAAAASVPIGSEYFDDTGVRRRRIV